MTADSARSAEPAASVPAAVAGGAVRDLGRRFDHEEWVRFLRERITEEWRPDEFDPDTWMFTGDPTNR